jgi:DNA-binding transcriptional MerR regulator
MAERHLRPVDLAREHGVSTQAVRNYEEEGVLPRAGRTAYGYRVYTPQHAQALRAFMELIPAHGRQAAAGIMRSINNGDIDGGLAQLDESHAQLLRDRRTLASVDAAVRDLATSTPSTPSSDRSILIGQLANDLGVQPATLRKWERAGLLAPNRDPATGYRVYRSADVRDARLAHQLRRNGHLLRQIAPVIAQLRAAGEMDSLEAMLNDAHTRLARRARSMLTAAAVLATYLDHRDHHPPDS